MTELEYINSLQIIYKYLKKAMSTGIELTAYGYISGAMDVIEAIIEKKGNKNARRRRIRKKIINAEINH